ncbi:MAG: GerMN domain-containing protein [Anaerolineales bacterium]|nr:GerMN domain-containing protein [Anaerolineales bacterium]
MKTRKLLSWLSMGLIGLLLFLAACANQETPTPPPAATAGVTAVSPGQSAQGQAFVDAVDVTVIQSVPPQVQATVSGNLSDACTTLTGVNVQRQDNAFLIDLTTSYDSQGACAQALVPFSETVDLDVTGLPAGTYMVIAGGATASFTLTEDNTMPPGDSSAPGPTPDLSGASLAVSPGSAQPGQLVILDGTGFPANTAVQIGVGVLDSEYQIVSSAQSGADGRFTVSVAVPVAAQPDEQWVFVANVNNASVLAPPLTVTGSATGNPTATAPAATTPAATAQPGQEGVNVPTNGLFNRTNIYLIALEDAGQSGPAIGCSDSAVPVVIDIEPTAAPLTAALNYLLGLNEQYYGQSGLYNALYQSDLTLQGVNIANGEATINLAGSIQLGGVCDDPRIVAQIEYTALQYDTVDRVSINLNGQPLESQIGGRG